jgi:putative oxidoreductase
MKQHTIEMLRDCGLLVLRVSLGAMMLLAHGWPKVAAYSEKSATFADPLGMSPGVTLAVAVFAEVLCALGIITGTLTRLAVIPLVVTMLVAALVVHAADPWAKKEFALLYLFPFLTLALTGAGRFSVDSVLMPRLSAWWLARNK